MKILICLDYSKAAEIILKEAIPFCKAFSQAEMFIYNVIDSAMVVEGPEYVTLETEAARLKKMAELAFEGKKINFNTEAGNPAEKIIDYVGETGCDLLILGTHGRTGMNHLIVGSVAEKVIRNITCNTLVVPMKNKI